MKTIKLTTLSVILLLAITLISSCKKDKTIVTENPFTTLFNDDVLSDSTLNYDFINYGVFEFGFEFSVTKNGKVTQLGVKSPDAGDIRATLWDLTDTSIIAQTTVTVVANTMKFNNLATAVELSTSKKYAITMLSNDWFRKKRTSSADYPYPITKGNVKIQKYAWVGSSFGTDAVYPTMYETDYLAGIVDFTYETEE
ncbi:MAG: DUF4082 domain-containing protein [Chitinophagales bacterium]|nr:DUF4082 domain-containing protein [Chitinophagales bacterium]